MQDIYGQALLDYYNGNYTEDIITETNLTEPDELPLPYLFRSFEEMPLVEQEALKACTGKVLDIGCGAGSHALWLQEQGLEVTAIDRSEGAVRVTQKRGIQKTEVSDILDWSEGGFDTLLLLMNGTGIFQTYEQVSKYLKHLTTLLNPKGQILIDTSDLRFLYDETEEGGIWVPGDRYYGELEFTMTYKGQTTDTFPWLYLDEVHFAHLAEKNGLKFEILARGEHFDYLAKLSL